MNEFYEGRAARGEWRKKRRKRRVLRGFAKLIFWTFVLAGVFVLGLGFGKTIADGDGGQKSRKVTVEQERGPVTATLPTKTVVKTTTVIKRVPAKRKRARNAR
jgi:hypothetical protein